MRTAFVGCRLLNMLHTYVQTVSYVCVCVCVQTLGLLGTAFSALVISDGADTTGARAHLIRTTVQLCQQQQQQQQVHAESAASQQLGGSALMVVGATSTLVLEDTRLLQSAAPSEFGGALLASGGARVFVLGLVEITDNSAMFGGGVALLAGSSFFRFVGRGPLAPALLA